MTIQQHDFSTRLDAEGLDRLFRTARTPNAWTSRGLSDATLREIYELAKWGPTSANGSPARFVFLRTPDAKARLSPYLSNANREKALSAPVCTIIAYDLAFAERIPELFPHNPSARHWFANPQAAETTAFRNGSLQGAYLLLAARALGLDCGPISGFDQEGVDREFFPDGQLKSNFLCSLGYGAPESIFARHPRLPFDDACSIQ